MRALLIAVVALFGVAAALRLLALVIGTLMLVALLIAMPDEATAAERWTPPVAGEPARLFHLGPDPFARGQHRGVDLRAAPGERVRAACAGRVEFAGEVAGDGTVSVRCGRWRVSYAPLRPAVRAGRRVGAGAELGRIAAAALHLGVRREGRRFGYVDPLPFLADPRAPSPPPLRAPRPRAERAPPRTSAAPRPALARWTVWLGLALGLTGLLGAGRLRLPLRRTGGAACRASSTSNSSPTTPSSR
jgi:hypothetical protein